MLQQLQSFLVFTNSLKISFLIVMIFLPNFTLLQVQRATKSKALPVRGEKRKNYFPERFITASFELNFSVRLKKVVPQPLLQKICVNALDSSNSYQNPLRSLKQVSKTRFKNFVLSPKKLLAGYVSGLNI